MNKNFKLFKINRHILLLPVITSLFLFLFINSGNINYAQPIHQNNYQYEKNLAYTFKVSDKLIGTGDMKLSIDKNTIKGTALGEGMTSQCNIDFVTNIEGNINGHEGNIKVNISGEGDPKNIPIPGKISFNGPLKGIVQNKKLNLIGKINIKGRLASFAGFKKNEDIVIEISDPALAKTLKELQNNHKLASL